jgi:hypothetical protein
MWPPVQIREGSVCPRIAPSYFLDRTWRYPDIRATAFRTGMKKLEILLRPTKFTNGHVPYAIQLFQFGTHWAPLIPASIANSQNTPTTKPRHRVKPTTYFTSSPEAKYSYSFADVSLPTGSTGREKLFCQNTDNKQLSRRSFCKIRSSKDLHGKYGKLRRYRFRPQVPHSRLLGGKLSSFSTFSLISSQLSQVAGDFCELLYPYF